MDNLWKEILEKNPRERLKWEKHPLDVLKDLPKIVKDGYEKTPEEDIVRLQWYGFYHDKPRTGYFMLRIKIPGGTLNPEQLETVGLLAEEFKDYAEITTRQDIQLHWVSLERFSYVLETLSKVGLYTAGACGDTVRNITTCPVCGIDKYELFGVLESIRKLEEFFHNKENVKYFNLPRKFKITLSACPYHCNHPELHDLAFVGTLKNGKEGFAVWVGGGLSSTPRLAKPLGIFIEKDRVLEVAKAIVDVWADDPESRKSFVKARIKYLVDRIGVERLREKVLQKLSFTPDSLEEEPKPIGRNFHVGVGKQKQEGFVYVCLPIEGGRVSGSQLRKLAELAKELDLSIRLSQRQNLILTHIPEEKLQEVLNKTRQMGFSIEKSLARSVSIACTSDPFCNYSVGSAKETLIEILDFLEKEVGELSDISIGVDGCPHACAHHWLNDIGLQATYIRHPDGSLESGLNLILGGSYGEEANIGKIVAKRVPIALVKEYLKRLIIAYRSSGYKSFSNFVRSLSDESLLNILHGAEGKEEEKESNVRTVKIRVFGPISKFFEGLTEIDAVINDETRTIFDVVSKLEREFPGFKGKAIDSNGEIKPYLKIFLKGEDIKFLDGANTLVRDGDEIEIYPALAGGAPYYDEREIYELALEYEDRNPIELLDWALKNFNQRFAIAWSGQAEDMVVLDMACKIDPHVRVFTIDTGRLHEETYQLIEEVRKVYDLSIEVYFPDRGEAERMVRDFGVNLFYKSVELRHLCCHVRKVRPLLRVLQGLDAWATGLRREQWASRHNIMKIEVDHDHGQIIKLNPLADWTERQVWEYIKTNAVPYNKLYDKSYKSIGCEPCTRAVSPDEDPRAGRWWWEENAPKECGIHCSLETGGFEKIADKILGGLKNGNTDT